MAHHLRLTDMTDREVLAIVASQADEEGYAESPAVAEALWPSVIQNGNGDAKLLAIKAVSQRLSWMARYGIVRRRQPQKGEPRPKYATWTLTDVGERLLHGKLKVSTTNAIDNLDGTAMVLAVHRLTEHDRDGTIETLMRRAWQYGMVHR